MARRQNQIERVSQDASFPISGKINRRLPLPVRVKRSTVTNTGGGLYAKIHLLKSIQIFKEKR